MSYYHFRLDASEPGTVYAKEFEDAEEVQYKIALDDSFPDEMCDLPTTITPPGMFADRQQYLFDNIRQFCSTEEAEPIVDCPQKHKTKGRKPLSKRKKNEKCQRKCSHCHELGHTKTVRGKTTCPKLLQY